MTLYHLRAFDECDESKKLWLGISFYVEQKQEKGVYHLIIEIDKGLIRLFNKHAEKLTLNDDQVIKTLLSIVRIASYLPTIGEVSRISGLSRGVTDRSLQKLCKRGYAEMLETGNKKKIYRFSIEEKGIRYAHDKGIL